MGFTGMHDDEGTHSETETDDVLLQISGAQSFQGVVLGRPSGPVCLQLAS